MAVHIKTNNDMVEVKLPRRMPELLEAMQGFVGGYIEAVGLQDGRIMWLNEEGKLKNLPANAIATDMARRLSRLHPASYPIVGDVLIATPSESGEGDEEEE